MNFPHQIYCDYLEDKRIDCRLLRVEEELQGGFITNPNSTIMNNCSNDGNGYSFMRQHPDNDGSGYGFPDGSGWGYGYGIYNGEGYSD